MLEVKKLTVKTQSGIPLLKDISFKLNLKERIALIGPNGVGKTTLLEAIMGISEHNISGDILINGETINSYTPEKRAKLGLFLSLQAPPEIPGVNYLQFLYSAYTNLHPKSHKSYYDFAIGASEIAEKLGLNDIEDRNLNEGFSGGERKKSEILQMLMLKPKYIMLDEVETGLDVNSKPYILEQIKKQKDSALLFVTHTKEVLEYLDPQKVLLLENGHLKKFSNINLALDFFSNEAV